MDSRPCKRSQGIQELALPIKYTLIIPASGHKMIQMLWSVWFPQLFKSQNSPNFQICSRQWTLKSASERKCCHFVPLQRPCGYKAKPSGANTAIGLHSWKSSRIPWSNGMLSPWVSTATQSHKVCIYTHTPQCGFDWASREYTGSSGERRTPRFSAVGIFELCNQTKLISKSSSGASLHLLRCISFRSECFQQHQ